MRALLSLAVLATTTTTTRAALRRALASTPAEGSPQDEYVRHWAHEGKSRCGAPNCRKLGSLAEFDLAKVLKRGTRAKSYGPGCRLILEHLSERCALLDRQPS